MKNSKPKSPDTKESVGRDGYSVHERGYRPKPSEPSEVIAPPQGGTGETVPTTRPAKPAQGSEPKDASGQSDSS